MPPKKDDKKGKNVTPSILPQKFESEAYFRHPIPINIPNSERQFHKDLQKSEFITIDEDLLEWTSSDFLNTEQWNEPLDTSTQIIYPSFLKVEGHTSLSEFFDLSPVIDDPKAKKKDNKAKAKGKTEEPSGFVELEINEEGRKLPFIISLKTEDEFLNHTSISQDFSTFTFSKELGYFSTSSQITDNSETSQVLDDEEEIDSIICNAFKFVTRFVSTLATSSSSSSYKLQSSQENFLWRSIYPKLPNGKPCYNPGGKYLVKLFVHGKWRKVYINDSFPLNNKKINLAHFKQDPYEIWPMLVSKAIYSAYSTCGYSTNERHSDISLFSFAIEALTGWSPQSIHSLTSLCPNKDGSNAKVTQTFETFKKLLSSGLPQLLEEEAIFSEEDLFEFVSKVDNNNSIDNSSVIESVLPQQNEEGHRLLTKKEFKDEYSKRKQKKDEIIETINSWNQKVNLIDQKVSNINNPLYFSAFYYQDLSNPANLPQIFPILALYLPKNESLTPQNLLDSHFLIDWKKEELKQTRPCVEDKMIKGLSSLNIAEFKESFPSAFPATYSWISFKDLIEMMVDNNIILDLLSFSTSFEINYFDSLDYKWNLKTPLAPPPVDPKAKKGTVIESSIQNEKKEFIEPTYRSPYILALDVRKFLINNEHNEEEQLVQEALAEQAKELNSFTSSELEIIKVSKSNNNSISLSLSLLKDIKLYNDSELYQNNEDINDDLIIIFQEIRFDNKIPIIFTLNPKKHQNNYIQSSYPPCQEDYILNPSLIPFEYMGKPILFWIRVLSKFSPSFSLSFSSNSPLALGSLDNIESNEKLKNMVNGSLNIFKANGLSGSTLYNTEQILFRIPLVPKNYEENSDDDINSSCRIFFHTSDDVLTKNFISLTDLTHDSDGIIFEEENYNNTEGLLFPLTNNQNPDSVHHTIMAKVDEIKEIHPYINLQKNINQLSSFDWLLYILTPHDYLIESTQGLTQVNLESIDHQSSNSSDFSRLESSIKIRYTGKYIPNSDLMIFKDIYTFDLDSFPLAFNFKIHDLFSSTEENGDESHSSNSDYFKEKKSLMKGKFLDNIPFKLSIYNLNENDLLVGEYISENSLSCYSITSKQLFSSNQALEDFKKNQIQIQEEKKLQEQQANTKKKDKNVLEINDNFKISIKLLFECELLDKNPNHPLPARFFSYLPHVFDDHFNEEPNPMYIPSLSELTEIRDSNRPQSPEKTSKHGKDQPPPPITSHISPLRSQYIDLNLRNLNYQRDLLVYKEMLPDILPNKDVTLTDISFPCIPLLRWCIDWLAGPPSSVHHDYNMLENSSLIVHSIESNDPGRYERSQVLKNYIDFRRKESEQYLANKSENNLFYISSWYTPSTNISLSQQMIDSLSQALQLELEETKQLFKPHHDIPLSNISELISIDFDGEAFNFDEVVFDEILKSYSETSESTDKISKLFLEKLNNLSDSTPNENIRSFITNYLTKSNENHTEFRNNLQCDIMVPREKLRSKTAIQNHALKLLLQRVIDAKNSTKAIEFKAAEEQKKLEAKMAKSKKK